MNTIRYFFLLIFGFLTACTPPKPAPEAPENDTLPRLERKAKTATISAWEISGAMAAKNQNKAWSASLNWKQQGASQYQIRLFGPMGGGAVLIEKKGGVITYQDGPKKVSSGNADQLLYQQTGIRLPVSNLYYWIRGLTAPGSIQSVKYDQYNHLSMLKQAGYTINYTRYTSVNGIDLPSKINLFGHGVTIKVVIKKWRV